MKLYYSPFACSLASHIACREAGLEVELERAELSTKRSEAGVNLFQLNPLGQVPTLILDDGNLLTENAAVLSYLADRAPDKHLAPPAADLQRYELIRWLSLVGTEIHKQGLYLLFAPDTSAAVKDYARAAIHKPLAMIDAHLSTRQTLVGEHFTVADAYLFWALTIAPFAGLELHPYVALRAYHERHLARPAVRAALRFEREQQARPFAAATKESARAD